MKLSLLRPRAQHNTSLFWLTVRRISYVLCGIIVLVTSQGKPVLAYTTDDFNCMYYNTCWYNPTEVPTCSQPTSNVATSANNHENLVNAYNYFLSKKLPDGTPLSRIQAAAIIGNIAHESGGDPLNTQTGFTPDRTTDPTQVSFNAKGDQGGWGLIQWTPASKVIGIAQKANITGPISELSTQLDLVWWHMNYDSPTSKKNMLAGFTQTDLREAVVYYELSMEGAGEKAYDSRVKAAEIALKYQQTGATYVNASSGCSCSVGNASNAPVVVLDPGHSGASTRDAGLKDSETGLYIGETTNPEERKQVWEVALQTKTILESEGYRVIVTKETEDEAISLKERATIANNANAAIAVSIHTDTGRFGDKEKSWVSPQKVGAYRQNDEGIKTTFSDSAVAAKSQEYSNKMIQARKTAGEAGTIEKDLNFDGRSGLSAGNISIVQLFSKVPWVYNETGRTGFKQDVYARGIAQGIMTAVPVGSGEKPIQARAGTTPLWGRVNSFFSPTASAQTTSATSQAGCGTTGSGSVAQVAINYAWPKYRKATENPTEKKPSYEQAIRTAKTNGKYTGDTCYGGGVDCGGFTTRVMQDSGVDPKYGEAKNGARNTDGQLAYVRENPDMYEEIKPKTTQDLAKYSYAIALRSGHTYLYIGEHAGFYSKIASASQCSRAPMAGLEGVADPDFLWFVVKTDLGV
ncbi:N-acetylmuramoyl-L-alanine amidase [Candidatus Saccharibacteria bacterium]|nr:MAG: N-acetylmuramoyl-L-alanine amidase [Candidatus Saccharibacteria bacterium]